MPEMSTYKFKTVNTIPINEFKKTRKKIHTVHAVYIRTDKPLNPQVKALLELCQKQGWKNNKFDTVNIEGKELYVKNYLDDKIYNMFTTNLDFNEYSRILIIGNMLELRGITLREVLRDYTNLDGQHLGHKDFVSNTILTLQSKQGIDCYAAFIPKNERIEVHTADMIAEVTNIQGVPHGKGDYIVCYIGQDGKPNLNNSWVVNGEIFPATYDMRSFPNKGVENAKDLQEQLSKIKELPSEVKVLTKDNKSKESNKNTRKEDSLQLVRTRLREYVQENKGKFSIRLMLKNKLEKQSNLYQFSGNVKVNGQDFESILRYNNETKTYQFIVKYNKAKNGESNTENFQFVYKEEGLGFNKFIKTIGDAFLVDAKERIDLIRLESIGPYMQDLIEFTEAAIKIIEETGKTECEFSLSEYHEKPDVSYPYRAKLEYSYGNKKHTVVVCMTEEKYETGHPKVALYGDFRKSNLEFYEACSYVLISLNKEMGYKGLEYTLNKFNEVVMQAENPFEVQSLVSTDSDMKCNIFINGAKFKVTLKDSNVSDALIKIEPKGKEFKCKLHDWLTFLNKIKPQIVNSTNIANNNRI